MKAVGQSAVGPSAAPLGRVVPQQPVHVPLPLDGTPAAASAHGTRGDGGDGSPVGSPVARWHNDGASDEDDDDGAVGGGRVTSGPCKEDAPGRLPCVPTSATAATATVLPPSCPLGRCARASPEQTAAAAAGSGGGSGGASTEAASAAVAEAASAAATETALAEAAEAAVTAAAVAAAEAAVATAAAAEAVVAAAAAGVVEAAAPPPTDRSTTGALHNGDDCGYTLTSKWSAVLGPVRGGRWAGSVCDVTMSRWRRACQGQSVVLCPF